MKRIYTKQERVEDTFTPDKRTGFPAFEIGDYIEIYNGEGEGCCYTIEDSRYNGDNRWFEYLLPIHPKMWKHESSLKLLNRKEKSVTMPVDSYNKDLARLDVITESGSSDRKQEKEEAKKDSKTMEPHEFKVDQVYSAIYIPHHPDTGELLKADDPNIHPNFRERVGKRIWLKYTQENFLKNHASDWVDPIITVESPKAGGGLSEFYKLATRMSDITDVKLGRIETWTQESEKDAPLSLLDTVAMSFRDPSKEVMDKYPAYHPWKGGVPQNYLQWYAQTIAKYRYDMAEAMLTERKTRNIPKDA